MTGYAGSLKERILVERRAATRDELGGADGDWAEVGLVWADILPAGAGRATSGDARGGPAPWVVTMRPGDVRDGDRLTRTGSRLRVTGVIRDPATPDRITIQVEDFA